MTKNDSPRLLVFLKKRYLYLFLVAVIPVLAVSVFILASRVPDRASTSVSITINEGDGMKQIADKLKNSNIIRSRFVFYLYAFSSGSAQKLKPGHYLLDSAMGNKEIIAKFVRGSEDGEFVITEGSTLADIDTLLSAGGVFGEGEFVAYAQKIGFPLEGYMFPDTYRFFIPSDPEEVAAKMRHAFNANALSLLPEDKAYETLVLASILEREVPDFTDRKIVAGILLKRLEAGWPLQVDATLCYVKSRPCYPLVTADFENDSPYNTYKYKGFPPTPIGNPGIEAIKAATSPLDSPYWFYLSDPKTRQTIFSKTLDEHNQNRVRYLSRS